MGKSAVRRAAPKGVNCYFDNVGGAISQAVLVNMAMYGRVAVCGAITGYNDTSPTLLPALQPLFVSFQIKMEGFFVWRWLHSGRWDEGLEQLASWVSEGKLQSKETVVEGFDQLGDSGRGVRAAAGSLHRDAFRGQHWKDDRQGLK